VPVEVRDVDASAQDRARWSDHVPVVLFDGEQHNLWFVYKEKLGRRCVGRCRATTRKRRSATRLACTATPGSVALPR
jgi:hypothetical protein